MNSNIIWSYNMEPLLSPIKEKKSILKKFLIFQEMELSSLIYFLYFIIFQEMELSDPNIKKFLIFSQKKTFLIFKETKNPEKILALQETELTYISGNNFPSSKNEKTHS